MKAPPLQRAEVVWITDLQPGTEVRGRQRSTSCLRRIGVAIALVLCAHWHFALVHTRRHDARPRDLFLSSFSSSSSRGTGRGRRRERRAPPPSPQVDDAAPYLVSPICGACSRALFDSRPCWTILERDAKKSHDGLTLRDAAAHLGRESENCALCDPERCWRHYHHNSTEGYVGADQRAKYWRFDRSGPRFSQPTTLTLATIPAELRIPPSRFDNIGTYFEEKYRLARANNASMDYLVEYNPGLAVLSAKMKEHLPKEATYLMSLRVTPANNCFSTQAYASLPQNVWNAVYHTSTNHLGLALLDEDYRTIPGYEAVVEIDAQLDLKRDLTTKKDRGGRKAGDYVETVSPTFMDYRLFVLNDEIYLHINADTVILSRLSLRAQGFGDDRAYAREVGACAAVVAAAGERGSWEKPCRLENLYGGDRLQVTLMRQFNTIWSGGANGKNYALFGVPDTKSPGAPDSVYAEIDIFPHHVQQILPEEHDRIEKQKIFDYLWKPGSRKSRDFKIDRVNMRKVREAGDIVESDRVPLPSYFTVDAHPDWFPGAEAPFKEGAHGGACCVLFSAEDMSSGGTQDDPPRESLLVGIGHTKG